MLDASCDSRSPGQLMSDTDCTCGDVCVERCKSYFNLEKCFKIQNLSLTIYHIGKNNFTFVIWVILDYVFRTMYLK